jgi:protein TonB
MVPLLILAALSQTVPSPPPGTQSVASLLSFEDYPAEAVRNNWQGDVSVKLNITKDGRVRACRIVQSSGYPVLDLKTCEVMLLRARFTPARNIFGQPVEDVFQAPLIRWRLQQADTIHE